MAQVIDKERDPKVDRPLEAMHTHRLRRHQLSTFADSERLGIHEKVFLSGVPIPVDENGTPDMSEVARIAWIATITIRWPPPT
jgi:hypothetical protein